MSIPFLEEYTTQEVLPLFKEYAYDFSSHMLKLKNNSLILLEGDEALQVWICKALLTKRYKNVAYDDSYGQEIYKYFGKVIDAEKKSNIRRYVIETLMANPYITSVENIEVSSIKDKIHITCTVKTIYKEVQVDELLGE